MTKASGTIEVYLEAGEKRTFASALNWPGWSRSGRDEESALRALCDYGARYARTLQGTRLGFHAPATPDAFTIVERLKGNTTTDFGAPDIPPARDAEPMAEGDIHRAAAILRATWRAFDRAAAAAGKELRKGPRGGGRDLHKITAHVREAEAGYVVRLGWTFQRDGKNDPRADPEHVRQAALDALAAAARGELPKRGPRGGERWSPRYFVRRAAWHVLDHAWEIEDRIA